MHFSLRNTGRVNAHSVEGVVYFPNDLKPELRDNTHPEKVEYFMNPERVVLRVENLPPKSNLIERHPSLLLSFQSNLKNTNLTRKLQGRG